MCFIKLSQVFPIPNKYIDKTKETELGKGGISFLTKDEVSIIDLTKNAFIMALTSHTNEHIWK